MIEARVWVSSRRPAVLIWSYEKEDLQTEIDVANIKTVHVWPPKRF